MKSKILKEFILLLIIGAGGLAILFIVPWSKEDKSLLSIEKEQELGEKLFNFIIDNEKSIVLLDDTYLDSVLVIVQNRLTDSNPELNYKYQIYITDNKDINAFSLPGGIILVNSGLIDFVDNPEELAAVIAHEMGHTENRHVITRLIKELGLKLLFSQDAYVLTEVAHSVTSLSYDRKQEREADDFAQHELETSGIEPKILGTLFRKMKDKTGDLPSYLEIVSTHPNFSERIKTCLEYETKEDFKESKININWDEVKEHIKSVEK